MESFLLDKVHEKGIVSIITGYKQDLEIMEYYDYKFKEGLCKFFHNYHDKELYRNKDGSLSVKFNYKNFFFFKPFVNKQEIHCGYGPISQVFWEVKWDENKICLVWYNVIDSITYGYLINVIDFYNDPNNFIGI